MKIFTYQAVLALVLPFIPLAAAVGEVSNGLAPEVTSLNAKDISWALEAKLPDLEKPYISVSPEDKKDGIPVGKLGTDGGDTNAVLQYAEELGAPAKVENEGDPKGEKTTGTIQPN